MKLLYFSLFVSLIDFINSVELTFELPDNDKQCYYQEIENNRSAILEYQVITGGQYDVDVELLSPTKEILYKQIKSQFDSHQFTATQSGVYSACFSNEFSTFSHKLVYMDFSLSDSENPLPGTEEHATVLTQMESTAQEIHKSLNAILDYQTHHRLREAQGRKRAEDLNERVLWFSLIETSAVLVIAITTVIVLRSFFTEKRPSHVHSNIRYQGFK
ncbi:unnamed protein product [Chironomus riparius]|uniref:GOLD domain-containing protein n=1 Tax=Chironomus riparius TaxID=315576 RepID=A0A9P0IU09_9DIPT|nr:unnamed protein product [Chironomus riparius]